MARDFNRLSLAVLTGMAHRRPMRLTLTDDTELVGLPVASSIDPELVRRNRKLSLDAHLPTRTVTIEGHEPVPILSVEVARWA